MLWLSPVSMELLEAIHIAAAGGHESSVGIMCSTSHVGPNAYTGMTHEIFADRVLKLRAQCNIALPIERDHLMKNGEDPDDWIPVDQAHLFTGAHLHVFKPEDALPVIEKYGHAYDWQIGPGEDTSEHISDSLWALTHQYARWFSFPMGTKIDGLMNQGQFNAEAVQRMRRWDVKVRAHNCDYLPWLELGKVHSHVDGINVAPQLGVVQSSWYLSKAMGEGYAWLDWAEACANDWKNRHRWCAAESMAVMAAGHYHYDMLEWRSREYENCVLFLAEYITGLLEACR